MQGKVESYSAQLSATVSTWICPRRVSLMFSSSREGRQTEGTGTFNIYYVQVQKVEEESGCLFASYLASHSGLTDGFLRPND